jgi:glycosyltransferase involved in cell wall biosynthesis
MLAGLSQARGDAVAIMDADLQHPPELLARMLPKLEQGYDQVVARRTRQGDARLRTFASRWYYRIFNKLVDVRLEDGVGDFRVLSRVAVRALLAIGEVNRFSKGLFSWIGFETAVVDYENVVSDERTSKWRTRDLVDYGIDGLMSFNNKPLRISIYFGAAMTAVAMLYGLWVFVGAVLNGNEVPGYVTLICAIVGLGGVQMIVLGVIGEYLGRIYSETKRRPHFLVKESSDGLSETPVAVALGPEHEHVEPRHPGN